ncbi:hypothetical protein Tco_0079462 [Tanacetum coccineum]
MNKPNKRFNLFLTVQKPSRQPSPDHAWITSSCPYHESGPTLALASGTTGPSESPGPTFELMKGTCKSLTELEYFCEEFQILECRRVIHFIITSNNDLEYLRGGVSSRKYSTSVTKTKAADYGHIKWIEDLVPISMWSQTIVKYDRSALWGISHWGKKRRQFYAFATSRESARDVYSKRRIIAVTKVEIVEWHDYKHLDWITVRRDDDALYTFKEGDFHRLRIQDIEDMLLLLVQGKVTNLSVEERIAFNVSLRMFTRRVVIQRRVEDLQLGVESYQKKLNLTKPDTYRSNLAKNKYQTFWNHRDKANARAMILAIDKRLKTRRIMRSLERFVGGRPYGGDLTASTKDPMIYQYVVLNLKSQDPVTLCTTPPATQVRKTLLSKLTENTHFYDYSHSELVEYEKVAPAYHPPDH